MRPGELDRPPGDPEHFGHFGDVEPREEAELDDLRLPLVERGEPIERLVEGEELLRPERSAEEMGVDVAEADAVPGGAVPGPGRGPRLVDEKPPHRGGSGGEEMGPPVPLLPGPVDQPEERLVDERGGLENSSRLPAPEEPPGDPLHLVVDQRHEPRDVRIGGAVFRAAGGVHSHR